MEPTWMNESLHRHVFSNFGKDTLQLVRELEKTARKLADYKNHLRLNMRCRQSNVIPKSLQMGKGVKGHRAENIMHRARTQLLKDRIRQTYFIINNLEGKMKNLQDNLATTVTEEVLEKIVGFTRTAQLAQHHKSKQRQIKKFQILTNQQQILKDRLNRENRGNHTKAGIDRDRWIKNISDRELTQTEKEVLSKGLNFSVTPNHIPVVDLITATETAIKRNNLTGNQAEELRLKISAALSSAKPPPSNLSSDERKALTALEKDHSINILPADKGRCTVILNAADYEAKVTNLLSDTTTYEALRRDPTSGNKKKVIDCLQRLERDQVIGKPLYYRLYPGNTTPCIYGLPKIHKEGIPLRPIVSSIDSITYNMAKHLATILAPLVGNTEHHVRNSQDFANKVKHLQLDSDETMVSYDVTSLFTCIPTTEAVISVRKRLLQDSQLQDRTNLTPDHICELLEVCLNSTYFQFRGNFYRQRHSCAMGSPISPIVANLYMEEVERRALDSFPGTTPSHWFRYVDDTWVKIKSQEVETFTDHINAVDKNIKFTREDTKDNTLAFLDCAVIIGEDRQLQVEVYRKPTHTDQYLLFDSNHPLQHKLGVIRTLQHRAQEVPTSSDGKKKEKQHIHQALRTCGYPKWAFTRSQHTGKQDKKEQETKRNSISIPYISGLSEKLKRIFKQHNIPVHLKPVNTLGQKVVHPKDKIPSYKQSNVVYSIHCKENCNEQYIGETKQPLHKRLYQHRRANPSGPESAVHLHLKATNHSFEDSEVRILARERGWFERGVKEAIFVKKDKPSLNKNGG
ncbi:uncharacterized protein LOC111949272, partial [Oryzias latipes]|uniref:uncharacterized protein LOC111949272 n=1 Tax=Oryzias latipes TaxID=8090 RepID=UPI000CE1F7E6